MIIKKNLLFFLLGCGYVLFVFDLFVGFGLFFVSSFKSMLIFTMLKLVKAVRERERERERERDRQRQRQRQTETETDSPTERDRGTETDIGRDRDRKRDKD